MDSIKKLILRKLSSYHPEEVDWIWEPYIARDMITIIEGDPNIGKSYLTMYLAAMMTKGGELPDGQQLQKEIVYFFSSEDIPEVTVRPRIEAMGGDARKIYFPGRPFTFTDECIADLDQHLAERNVGLIVVDTLFSFLPDGVDTSKPSAIRERLHKLAKLAQDHDCAIIIVRHWTKGDRGKAIYRGGGLIDIVGVARSGLTIAVHPEDPKLRIMAHMKYSVSEQGESRVFELVMEEGKNRPILVWHGTTDITADELEASGNAAPKALDNAVIFLTEELQGGPKQATVIKNTARTKGIATRTIERAKKELGVLSKKTDEGWIWRLPSKSIS